MPAPTTIQVPLPIPTVSTPAVPLPCGLSIPAIPLLKPFSLSITLPAFPPGTKKKSGPKNSRTTQKWVNRLKRLNKLCPGLIP